MLLLCVSKLIAFNLENEFSVLTLCLSVLSFCVSSYTRVRLHGWMVVHSKHTGARIDLWLSWSVFTDWLSLVMWCSATYGSSEEFLMCLFLSLFFFLNCRIKIKAIKLIYWHIKLCKQSKNICYVLWAQSFRVAFTPFWLIPNQMQWLCSHTEWKNPVEIQSSVKCISYKRQEHVMFSGYQNILQT